MSRVLIIGSDAEVSREIGRALSAADFPMEYSAGDADTLQRLRVRSFGVVITNPDSSVEEDLALLEEMRTIRPGSSALCWLVTVPRTKLLLPFVPEYLPASPLRLTPMR